MSEDVPAAFTGVTIADAKPASVVFQGGGEPLVIFRPDGTIEFPKGETREAAKAFWGYVEQYMGEAYRRHAASAASPTPSPHMGDE